MAKIAALGELTAFPCIATLSASAAQWEACKEEQQKMGNRPNPGAGGTVHGLGRRSVHCVCTYPILCEVRQAGGRLGFPVFFDDGPESETRGERVSSCPGCGRALGIHLLRA